MVKRSRVLDEAEEEAELPYAETALARRAMRSRPRLAVLLLAGGGTLVAAAALAREPAVAAGAIVAALVAWGVRRERLGGIVAAGLVSILAFSVPIAFMFLEDLGLAESIALALVAAWGAALAPDVILLVRDAELQHAYGRWARRG